LEQPFDLATFGSESHYHIRWSDLTLDWLAFPTEKEAKTYAECLKRRWESYAVEQCDANCERCKEFKARANA